MTQLIHYSLQTNTFQAVLVTNGTESYVLYLYKTGAMKWNKFNLPSRYVLMGYRRGVDDTNYVLTSRKDEDILNIDKRKGNTGRRFLNIFRDLR